MGRLIDADALLKHKYHDSNRYENAVACYYIHNAPTIDVPTWIPCSERLPSEEEQDTNLGVLVTLGHGYKGMDFDWYHDGHWYDWDRCVIAWMPLPEPWKGTDDGADNI